MVSFWRRGFGSDSSWDVDGVPSGDYRIATRGVGEEWPDFSSWGDEWWMRCRIQEIVFFATPYRFSALDPGVVQALLDIHEAVYPATHHPAAEQLLRQRHHGEYLRALGADLEAAVAHRLLRVERLTRPWPFVDIEEKLPAQAPSQPKNEDAGTVRLELTSPEALPIPEASFVVHFADGSERRGRLDREGKATLRDTPTGPFEVEYLDYEQIRAKGLAARAHAAVAQKDIPSILGVLCQSSPLLRLIAAAYREYFDDGHQGFPKAMKGATTGTPSETAVEYLLGVAGIDPDSDASVVAMATPQLADDIGSTPNEEGGSVVV